MTQYAIPEAPGRKSPQDNLFVIPAEGQDNMGMITWKDREEKPEPLVYELFVNDSVHGHLGRIALAEADGRGDHDRFVTTLHWAPYSQQEATVALKTLTGQASINRRTRQGDGLRAVEELLNEVDRFKVSAVITLETLKEALTTVEPDDIQPSVNLIKSNSAVRVVLSEFMLAQESLDRYKWMPKKTNGHPNVKREQRLLKIDSLIDTASDEDLTRIWQKARLSNISRLQFWDKQLETYKESDQAV